MSCLVWYVCASPTGVRPECYTANGEDYRGMQNRTAGIESGKACLYWNETFQHPYNTVKYPNGEGGLGPHNYCR